MLTVPTFERPLAIFVGLGFPHQLTDVAEAKRLLDNVPSALPDHRAAIEACRAALAGTVEAETARAVLERYFDARGLLAFPALQEEMVAAKTELLSA